jgi:hypothetical protein
VVWLVLVLMGSRVPSRLSLTSSLSRFLHAPAPPLPTHFVFASAGSVFIYANCLNYPPRHALVAVHAVDGSHSGATRHES